MSILVTGGTGDVGRRLLRQLVEIGEKPVAFDIAPKTQGIEDILDKIVLVRGDVLNLSEILHTMRSHGISRVLHLASLLTADAEDRPYQALMVNVMGTANVLEASRITGVRRLVYTSTSSVYGPTEPRVEVREDYPKEPNNVYGISKYAAEAYGKIYSEKYGLSYVVVRPRIVLGGGQRKDTGAMKILKVHEVLEKIFREQEATIPYHPEEKLEVTHPEDAAQALRLACYAESLPHKAYNIMSGSFKYSEIAQAFEKAWPGAVVRAEQPTVSARVTARRFGVYDIGLAKRELGFKPHYDIDRIVKEIVDLEAPQLAKHSQ